EAYDVALANLDPTLERRPAPEDALAVIEAFPYPLTTAEVAAVMAPRDTAEPDLDAAAAQLSELAQAGRVVCEAAGTDALWRLPGPDARDRAERADALSGVA